MTKRFLVGGERRKARVRANLLGQGNHPRLSVFRSQRYIYAQIIDPKEGTLVAASEKDLETKVPVKSEPKIEKARLVGKKLAEKALKKGIKEVVFDRGSYKFHGRVKALAEAAREGGLKF